MLPLSVPDPVMPPVNGCTVWGVGPLVRAPLEDVPASLVSSTSLRSCPSHEASKVTCGEQTRQANPQRAPFLNISTNTVFFFFSSFPLFMASFDAPHLVITLLCAEQATFTGTIQDAVFYRVRDA